MEYLNYQLNNYYNYDLLNITFEKKTENLNTHYDDFLQFLLVVNCENKTNIKILKINTNYKLLLVFNYLLSLYDKPINENLLAMYNLLLDIVDGDIFNITLFLFYNNVFCSCAAYDFNVDYHGENFKYIFIYDHINHDMDSLLSLYFCEITINGNINYKIYKNIKIATNDFIYENDQSNYRVNTNKIKLIDYNNNLIDCNYHKTSFILII